MRIKGQATLAIVFIVGLASMALALGVASIGGASLLIAENNKGSKMAIYAAEAGVEDLISRLQQNPNLGVNAPFSTNITLLENDSSYVATVSALPGERVATATGRFKDFEKVIEVKMSSASASVPFTHAVQTGFGGLEIGLGAEVKCLAPCTDGNVYSNGDIKGRSTNSSKISGSAWTNGSITGLGSGGGIGVLVTKNASASALVRCQVNGSRWATSTPSSTCSGGTFTQTSSAPPVIPLPAFDEAYWKQQALAGGEFVGDCDVLSGGSDDCTNGTGRVGPIKITGNLNAFNGTTVTVSGPIWVTGDVNFDNGVIVALGSNFTQIGTVMVTDGKLLNKNNVVYEQNGSARLLSVSSYTGDATCESDIAIPVAQNVEGLIAYAKNGCIKLEENAIYKGAIAGEKIVLSNNSLVEYDPDLATAIFGVSAEGGWTISSWREID